MTWLRDLLGRSTDGSGAHRAAGSQASESSGTDESGGIDESGSTAEVARTDEATPPNESTRRDPASDSRRSGAVGLFVDGPNVIREEFSVDLDDVREAATEHGSLTLSRCYLDEHAPASLVQAAEARGFEVVVTSGDVDVRLATDAAAAVADASIDVLALASRDTDFKPVLETARLRGVHTVALAPGEYGNSDALANAADEAVVLAER